MTVTDAIEVRTLTDGGQTAADIAGLVEDFVGQAHTSLDVALYDLNLLPATRVRVAAAFEQARSRGVIVRLLLNTDHPGPIPVPPPPKFNPDNPPELDVPTRLVAGIPDLMHHKYIVRDGQSVWTGSTNWTDDSWTREENIIVTVASEAIAAAYTADFEELWNDPNVAQSGRVPSVPCEIPGGWIRSWFCPGEAQHMVQRISTAIGRARHVRIASPVLTSGPILATLAEAAQRGDADIAGVLDATQMQEVYGQWRGQHSWKLGVVSHVLTALPFTGKRSTPYAPGSVHDYMHAKIMVADGIIFTGSFNLSHSGEMNAENVLEMFNPALASRLAAFIDSVRSKYGPAPVP